MSEPEVIDLPHITRLTKMDERLTLVQGGGSILIYNVKGNDRRSAVDVTAAAGEFTRLLSGQSRIYSCSSTISVQLADEGYAEVYWGFEGSANVRVGINKVNFAAGNDFASFKVENLGRAKIVAIYEGTFGPAPTPEPKKYDLGIGKVLPFDHNASNFAAICEGENKEADIRITLVKK